MTKEFIPEKENETREQRKLRDLEECHSPDSKLLV
jgi:hypothetical protein